jgi:beta-glucosidase
VLYARGADLADGFPVTAEVPSTPLTTADGSKGARAEIFIGRGFDGAPVITRTDSTISADWAAGSPRADIPVDSFSVRWTTTFTPRQSGRYTLGLNGTMRFRLLVDDSVVSRSVTPRGNDEYPDPRTIMSRPLILQAGHPYKLVAEGIETYGDAQLQLLWTTPSDSLVDEAVRVAQNADAVVLMLGLTSRLEGEEMPVSVPGFKGGDRITIDLPAPQEKLLERVAALGKPTVLVLLNGSALAVNWASEHVPAIVEAWYPGEDGGTAIADVLFGNSNPAGRLPVTFYKDTTDLPPFSEYRMAGRTYRYFKGTPLFAFGHGLSYTSFGYRNLRVSGAPTAAKPAMVTLDITNTGKRAGEEVVQMYVRYPVSKLSRSTRELRGFQRISLAPGETKRVTMPLTRKALAYWDDTTHAWAVEPGAVSVEIGASSADIRLQKSVVVKGGAP